MKRICQKTFCFKSSTLPVERGASLTKIIISLLVISTTFSLGLTGYNIFNRQRLVIRTTQEFKDNLRLAQGKALVGEKPLGCKENLTGYKLAFLDSKSYEIIAHCGGNDYRFGQAYALPGDIMKVSGPNEVFFLTLPGGVEAPGEIYLSGYGKNEKIVVESAGNIFFEETAIIPN